MITSSSKFRSQHTTLTTSPLTDAASSLVCPVGLDEWECATGLEVERLAVIVVSARLYILDYT